MGAWTYLIEPLHTVLAELGRDGERLPYVGRPAAAAPATGLMRKHLAEQEKLIDEALTPTVEARPSMRVSSKPAPAPKDVAKRRETSRTGNGGGRSTQATAKKAAAGKKAAKKAPAKKAGGKKPAAKKAAAKKSGATKASSKRGTGKSARKSTSKSR